MDEAAATQVASALRAIAHAVSSDGAGNTDASGTYVNSLTEAVMGMTAALVNIQYELQALREAVEAQVYDE